MTQKKLDYIIKLTYDKSYKGYVADVVNLYGCMFQGKTKKEALENSEKAIKAYMEAISKDNKGGRREGCYLDSSGSCSFRFGLVSPFSTPKREAIRDS